MNVLHRGEISNLAAVFEPVIFTKSHKDDGTPNIFIGAHSRIDGFTKIEGGEGVVIGQHVHIASFAHINIGGGKTIIEDGAAVASGCRIISGGNRPEGESCSAAAPLPQQVLKRETTILRKNSCIFAGVTVVAGVEIGEGARVAAGAVVTKDVPPFEIWGGIPARQLVVRRSDR